MALRIVSNNSEPFIRKSSFIQDEKIALLCEELKTSPERLSYKNITVPLLIEKPWGEETLIGFNNNIELWELILQPNNSTSYHGHMKKDTLLILIKGKAQLRTEGEIEILQSGDFRLIEKKTFHQTTCLGEVPVILCEIESPVDKNDLVRIEDKYQREGRAYLHKSKLRERKQLTQIVLMDRKNTLEYFKQQDIKNTFENKFPIHVTKHLGITRLLHTLTAVIKQSGDNNLKSVVAFEIFVPSLESIELSKEKPQDNYDQFLIRLDRMAQKRSAGQLRGDSRLIHLNAWDEISIVLSGEFTLVEFEPNNKEKEIMRNDENILYELGSVAEVKKRNFKNLSIKRMKTGDIFFSKAGCAHGVYEGSHALYLTFIIKKN